MTAIEKYVGNDMCMSQTIDCEERNLAKDSFLGVPVLLFSLTPLIFLSNFHFSSPFSQFSKFSLGTKSNSLNSFAFHRSSLMLLTSVTHTQTSLQTQWDHPAFCFCSSRFILLSSSHLTSHFIHHFPFRRRFRIYILPFLTKLLLQTALLFSHCTLFLLLFSLRSPIK